MHIKDTIKYKERQDISKLDKTIEHMRIECQGKNKKQKLPCRCFLPTTLWRQRKTDVDQKLDTILSAITAPSNQAIVIAEYTNIDCNKPSTVLETCKEVLDTYNLKTHRSHC